MNRRIKVLKIVPQILVAMSTQGQSWSVVKGIPKDAQFRGIVHDAFLNTINIFIEHESFEEIEEGNIYPDLICDFRTLEKENE